MRRSFRGQSEPWVGYGNAHNGEVAGVAGDDRKTVECGSGGDKEIRLRGGMRAVTFNGHSFDLPVLRYRAMINKVPAPGLSARPYL